MTLSVSSVRHAEPADAPLLAGIEAAADARFAGLMDISAWGPAMPGEERAARPGALLVVGTPAIGFAHLVEVGGALHLEQVCVHPSRQGLGVGTMLLHAAYGVVLDSGRDRLTLTTYADVPWNAPWYAAHGFTVVGSPSGALADIVAHERAAGLERGGRRVALERAVRDEPVPIPAVSVIPVRDGTDGLEVFVQHRVSTMDFAANAVVFPGGRIDPGDAAAGAALDLPGHVVSEHARAWRHTAYEVLGGADEAARTVLACGVREVLEETGARIDPARLVPWDDWETPVGVPKRFDVRFLLYPVTDDVEAQAFSHTTTEAHRSEWMPARAVAAGAETGELILVTPTRVLIEELAALPSVAAAAALRPPVTRVRHDITPSPGRRGRLIPHE